MDVINPQYYAYAVRMEQLTVYRNILNDDTLQSFLALCRTVKRASDADTISRAKAVFTSKLLVKAETLGFSGSLLCRYLIYLFLHDENIYTLACERGEQPERTSLYAFARADVEVLYHICKACRRDHAEANEYLLTAYTPVKNRVDPYLDKLEHAPSVDVMMETLTRRYTHAGAGDMAVYTMFRIAKVTVKTRRTETTHKCNKANDRNGDTYAPVLVGLPRIDPVTMDDIVGYDRQKDLIIRNTEAFLAGQPANNVLLSGSRGTGKSSCVKAVVNRYAADGLRLIEIRKDQSRILPGLLAALAERGKHFILFMDDLSFESFETQYKYLKSLLEGGAAERPTNVLFYATSNRRHIIREGFGDRNDQQPRESGLSTLDNEIHASDTVNEKLSLSDRFGITLTFPNVSQEEYINIVLSMAERRGVATPSAILAEQAVRWALAQHNISGRTARQFMDYVCGTAVGGNQLTGGVTV